MRLRRTGLAVIAALATSASLACRNDVERPADRKSHEEPIATAPPSATEDASQEGQTGTSTGGVTGEGTEQQDRTDRDERATLEEPTEEPMENPQP